MKKLAWITVGFTYLLMVWGNLVSATGSGLACPDWPLCHGTIAPPFQPDIVLEWGHRLLAAASGTLIIVTLIQVFRASSHNRTLTRSGITLLILLALQVSLGGLTVLLGLSTVVSTIHLLIASLVFGGMITVASAITWGSQLVIQPQSDQIPRVAKIKRLAFSGLIALCIQLVLGALVRHTHSGLACPHFPGCLDGFFPDPWTGPTSIAFIHRWWGFILLGLFFHLSGVGRRLKGQLGSVAQLIAGLGIAQVLLGILTVTTALHTHVRALHAAIGYALWGLLFFTVIRAGGLRWIWESKNLGHRPAVD